MGALGTTHERAFQELLVVDAVRGIHSTGMASYNPLTKDINIAKEVGPPHNLLGSKEWNTSMSKINRLLLGHNRYATRGSVNRENAHPFKQSNIIGAHNGSLTYMGQQKLEDKDHKFTTDSEAIFWSISTRGFDETYRYLASPTYDMNAFALTWFDTKTNKFYLIRNKKRSLFYAYTEKKDAIFWASEVGALHWILYRNGLSTTDTKTYYVNEDTLYEWDIATKHDEVIGAPTMRLIETPAPIYPAATTYYHSTHYHQDSLPFVPDDKKKSSNVIQLPSVDKVNNFRPPYKSDKGYVIGKRFVNSLTEQGCFYCGQTEFKWGEFAYFPTFGNLGTTEYLCKNCYLDNDIRELVHDCSHE